ncbi:hypothetical protein U9M48_006833 [Paspalum notatum var. saurae]|uniref:Uncharacterized protein n=1 Tax=Paspalum notatum var. saurae TaxID=547442 RepID=A0AAQ3PPZ7_PASNO
MVQNLRTAVAVSSCGVHHEPQRFSAVRSHRRGGARAARCPKIRRFTSTFGCPARAPGSLCGAGGVGARCSSVPGPGTGAVARDDPRPGPVRARGQGRQPAPPSRGEEKRGSVAGAVALIVGTSIGSGILAVPQRTAPAHRWRPRYGLR